MGRCDYETETMVAEPIAFPWQQGGSMNIPVKSDGTVGTLVKDQTQAIAFQERGRTGGRSLEWQGDLAYSLNNPGDGGRAQERNVLTPDWAVRRLTPRECERLQGFPDDFTEIPWRGKTDTPDGPRYKALGNSMAVPCIAWIMNRLRASMEVV